ncbi:MAG: response regulator [Proteobacteria bacterium]|nr:response regulator [Pseudomonadota bacterium]
MSMMSVSTQNEASLPILVLSNDLALRQSLSALMPASGCIGGALSQASTLIGANQYACIFIECGEGQASAIPDICGFQGDLAPSPIVTLMHQPDEENILCAMRHGAQECLPVSDITPAHISSAVIKAKEAYAYRKSRHRAEEELQQIRKMEAIGRLTSGVAHDFNNLLTVVMGNIHLLRRRFINGVSNYDPADIMTKIEAIESVADKGAELVRRLMVFTRQTPLTQEVVSVNASIEDTYELLKRAVGETVEVTVLLDKEAWDVVLDPLEFENMLINFAVNARDAMPGGGKLTIETHNVEIDAKHAMYHPDMKTGPYIMIAISDTGIGMTPDVMKNVFEPFFTTKPPGEGTGLGMSMAYGFVKQCGGYLHVYSEVGNGTVFRVYLPRHVSESAKPLTNSFEAESDIKKNVLVVDDDIVMRTIASATLQGLGFEVMEAEDGRTALEILKSPSFHVDVLFTDINMPGDINGIELAKKARNMLPHIKVLLSSGYSECAIPDYILNSGESVISKPYHRDILLQKMNHIIDGE